MNQEKNNKKKSQLITILVFSVIIIVILGIFIFYFGKSDNDDLDEIETETQQAVLIPIEFLNEEELNQLGVNPNTKAQIISRDPLIYKIIEDDQDIIEDISPYLEAIRE